MPGRSRAEEDDQEAEEEVDGVQCSNSKQHRPRFAPCQSPLYLHGVASSFATYFIPARELPSTTSILKCCRASSVAAKTDGQDRILQPTPLIARIESTESHPLFARAGWVRR